MENFILNANKKHEKKYDYSKVKYVNAKTRIKIICPTHEEFEQTPDRHLRSNGCQKCTKEKSSLSRRLTQPQFINKALEVHGDRYDYSDTTYVNAKTHVKIICPTHEEFKQTPNGHLSGKGCKQCGVEKRSDKQRKTLEQFIKEARDKHGDKFDYKNVKYINTHTRVKIICPIHNEFEQSPIDHIISIHGCKHCGDTDRSIQLRSNTDEFINKALEVHGDRYDYSEVEYETNIKDVIIKCKTHGTFLQQPRVHLQGSGCIQCANDNQGDDKRYTNEEFIEKAMKVHRELYIYDNIKYITSHIHVIIKCVKHGEFIQTPNSHLSGRGCPSCINKTEQKLYELLSQIYPLLEKQYKVEWCKNKLYLPFDFVLKLLKIIIELDGSQHFIQVSNWEAPEETRIVDLYKMKCANDNGFSVIRILQEDVYYDRYDWLSELVTSIKKIVEENKVQNIYLCKNNEYNRY